MLFDDLKSLLCEEDVKKLIKNWIDVQEIINYFCQSQQVKRLLEEIRYLTTPEYSLSFLENKLNEICKQDDLITAYFSNYEIFINLLSIYKNFYNYLNLLNEQNNLKNKLEFIDHEPNDLAPFYLVNLNNFKLLINQIAMLSNWRFVEYKPTEKQNFKIGYFESNYSDKIFDLVLENDSDKRNQFIKAVSNVELSLKNLDIENTIAHLMYLFRVVENEFSLYFNIIDNDYSTLVRRFIHSVVRHDGYLNESQGMKLRHGFQSLSKETQIGLLEDAKNYLVTIKLLSCRKNPDIIYKKFSQIILDNDITLPGFIPIEIAKINEINDLTNFIEVHRDGKYDNHHSLIESYDNIEKINFNIPKINNKDLNDEINNFQQEINKNENTNEFINNDEIIETNINNNEFDLQIDSNICDEKIEISNESMFINEIEQQSIQHTPITNIERAINESKIKKEENISNTTICYPTWQNDETTKQMLIDIGVQKKKMYDFDENINYAFDQDCINDNVTFIEDNNLSKNVNLIEQNYLEPYFENINFDKPKKQKTKQLSMKELRKEAHEKMLKLHEKMNGKTKNKNVD